MISSHLIKTLFSLLMMRLYGALILSLILSTACGLKCYSCATHDPKSCTRISNCPHPLNSCFSRNDTGTIVKGCRTSFTCTKHMYCCEEDLCNSATATGSSAVLLLVSSAITTFFL